MLHFLVLFIQGNENISIRGGEEFHETFPFRELTARRSNLNVCTFSVWWREHGRISREESFRVVFLVKLNENSDLTSRDRHRERNSDLSFLSLSLCSSAVFSARHENSHCAFSCHCLCVQRQREIGFYGSTSGRDSWQRGRKEESAVKCHGDYLMSDVIVKTVEP